MVALVFLLILAAVLGAVWITLAKNANPKAKIGPDGTNVREPETFVAHHEGKGQGLDMANTPLKERTKDLRRDLPEAEGRPVTDLRRDVEVAAEFPAGVEAGQRHLAGDIAASRFLDRQESGYGLGKTARVDSDGEGGPDDEDRDGEDDYAVEQPDLTDEISDVPNGHMPAAQLETEIGFAEAADEWNWETLDEEYPLPDTYAEDMVVAIVRNPRSLYVYWERGGWGDENLRAMLGEETWRRTSPVLRVYDVTEGAYPGQPTGRPFLIPVGEEDDSWFIHEGIEPGHRYVVSYERALPDGTCYLIAHSAPVQTPVDRPARRSAVSEQYGGQAEAWSGTTGGNA